jgi:hypothetical protein
VRNVSVRCVLAVAAWAVLGPAWAVSADTKEPAARRLGRQDLIQARSLAIEHLLRLQDLDPKSPDYGAFWDAYYPEGVALPGKGKYFGDHEPRRGITQFCQPYMEVAGFTLETLAEASALPGEQRCLEAAAKCVDEWFIKRLQLGEERSDVAGAMPFNVGHKIVYTFDNGEAMRGTLCVYHKTRNPAHLQLVEQIAQWGIGKRLRPDGSMFTAIDLSSGAGGYTDPDFMVYQGRAWGWSLLELWKETGKEQYRDTGEKVLRWVLGQQQPSGFMGPGCLEYGAYAAEGLYFGGKILANEQMIAAARKFLDAAIRAPHSPQGFLYVAYRPDWTPADSNCLWSVEGQHARLCYTFYRDTKDVRYLKEGDRILRMLLNIQVRESKDSMMIGGLPCMNGSGPEATRLPLWTAKYFVDCVNLRLNLEDAPLD